MLWFYFSNVMDKLGRAASLAGLGILFLAGGSALERVRRRLVARIGKGPVCDRCGDRWWSSGCMWRSC